MAQVPVFTLNAFPTGSDNTQHQQVLYGFLTFTGSGGYTTGGLPITWTFLNADGSPVQPVASPSQPFLIYFQPQDSGVVQYQWNKASNVLFATTGGTQVSNATTLSGVTTFEAHFARGI